MIKKDIPFHELNYYYDKRLGWTFTANSPSSEKSVERCCELLKHVGVSEFMPEFYAVYGKTTVLVYPEEAHFYSGRFYAVSQQLCHQIGFLVGERYHIDTLAAWIKDNVEAVKD